MQIEDGWADYNKGLDTAISQSDSLSEDSHVVRAAKPRKQRGSGKLIFMLQWAQLIGKHSSSLIAKALSSYTLYVGEHGLKLPAQLWQNVSKAFMVWQRGWIAPVWSQPITVSRSSSWSLLQAVCLFVLGSCAVLSSCLGCFQIFCLFFPFPPFTPTLFIKSLYHLIFRPLVLPCQGDGGKLQLGDSLIFHPN